MKSLIDEITIFFFSALLVLINYFGSNLNLIQEKLVTIFEIVFFKKGYFKTYFQGDKNRQQLTLNLNRFDKYR